MPTDQLTRPWAVPGLAYAPDELQMFLQVLQEFEGAVWNAENQVLFQIILIQRYWQFRYNSHFTAAIGTRELWSALDADDNISFDVAERLLKAKGYADPTRRSRIVLNMLERWGFATARLNAGVVMITPMGRPLLNPKADLRDVFLRQLLRWQLPNPMDKTYPARLGYRIKPLVGTLHLIRDVDTLSDGFGLNTSGLSLDEFEAFVPTLIDYQKIFDTALSVVDVRLACLGLSGEERENRQKALIGEYLKGFDTRRLKAYARHTLNYFRMTWLIRYIGDGQFVGFSPNGRLSFTPPWFVPGNSSELGAEK